MHAVDEIGVVRVLLCCESGQGKAGQGRVGSGQQSVDVLSDTRATEQCVCL